MIRLGLILRTRGICDEKTILRARALAEKSGQSLGVVLMDMGAITQKQLDEALAEQKRNKKKPDVKGLMKRVKERRAKTTEQFKAVVHQ